MEKACMKWAAFHGFFAVAMGAFAAHVLSDRISEEALGWVRTASQYQLAHALALLGLAAAWPRLDSKRARQAAWCFAVGTAVFAGCLYLMALTNTRWLGAVVPLGGLGQLAGWLLLGLAAN